MELSAFAKRIRQARNLTCAMLPHLSSLAHEVKVSPCEHISTAGVFASGHVIFSPTWLETLSVREATFVFAHELMHLLLESHARDDGEDPWLFNIAHDYIINDTLRQVFDEVLAGGLDWHEARHMSAEQIYHGLRARDARRRLWANHQPTFQDEGAGVLSSALARAGLIPAPGERETRERRADVLDAALERAWFQDITPKLQRERGRALEPIRARAAARQTARQLAQNMHALGRGAAPGHRSAQIRALRDQYVPPWERALQRWFDTQAPPRRTWSRASRRGPYPHGVLRPGKRETRGWTLHVVLDTSGSMHGALALALGRIAAFAQASGVERVHILQCDTHVTSDAWVDPQTLADFEVRGLGGSNMTPAMLKLAEDPEVTSALVLTDGGIAYPPKPMPYQVLWGLLGPWSRFQPTYGEVVRLRT